MFTKEQVIASSSMARRLSRKGISVKIVLTTEEQNQLAKNETSFTVISDGEIFFFTDDYCVGVDLFPKEFVPASFTCPMLVKPRECLPDGIIRTAEQFISVFENDRKQINTIDELVDYLNDNYT